MKKHFLPLVALFLLAGKLSTAQPSNAIKEYIETYKEAAMEEMKRSGVPASITLAQGILETDAGRSVLVKKSNNHFGIKCKTGWQGESVSHDDDARGECFRKYPSALDSYKDHSDFLRNRPHYAALFTLDPTDYEGWAYGLKKAGYATNPKYPQILIRLITTYNLHDYTLIALGKKAAEPKEAWASNNADAKEGTNAFEKVPAKKVAYSSGVFKINDTKVIFISKGTPYLVVAQQHDVALPRLFEFNDLEPKESAAYDQLMFLQRKRKTGANDTHTIVAGETLHSIAQEEGIRLESLLALNHLSQGAHPVVGEVLQLQKKASASPKLVTALRQMIASVQGKEEEKEPAPVVQSTVTTYVVHTVKPKETLYSIAKRYAVSVDDVRKWNNLQTSDLKVGQELRINKKAADATYKSA